MSRVLRPVPAINGELTQDNDVVLLRLKPNVDFGSLWVNHFETLKSQSKIFHEGVRRLVFCVDETVAALEHIKG